MAAPLPPDEAQRLRALRGLGILDTEAEERFDRLTRMARRIFDVPMAMVSLVDEDRQWFKSAQGMGSRETPREHSFCAHAILDQVPMVVPDAMEDERFRDNPLVEGDPRVRFYAAAPIHSPDGHALGTICVLDHEPREMNDNDLQLLQDIAHLVEREVAVLDRATTDPLTGLVNLRGFEQVAHHILALCQRLDRTAALVALDLDELKAINKADGVGAGDAALRGFAEDLQQAFRNSDAIARIGGDEFVVLVSGADPEHLHRPLTILEIRVQTRNERSNLTHPVEFSAAVILYDPEVHHSPRHLISAAASRVQRVKERRRERAPEPSEG